MADIPVGSLRHRQDVARELWGSDFIGLPWRPTGYNSPVADFHTSYHDEHTHPLLHNLTRVVKETDAENLAHHRHHRFIAHNSAEATPGTDNYRIWGHVVPNPGYTPEETWHELAHTAYAHKRPPISDKTRALIHNPHVAADQLEEEGHGELAKFLREATHVDTHHGDDANYPDVAFTHNGRHHLLVRSNLRPLQRFHFVGPPLK